MLNFRNTNIVFGLIAIGLLVIHLGFAHLSWYVPALFLVDYSLLLFYGSYQIESGFFLKAFCRKDTTANVVSITFDDGPSKEITPAVLDVLREYNIKAGFFCIGKNIPGNEPLLKRMQEEGHVIGNHSFSHDFWFDLNTTRKMAADLLKTDVLISSVTGKKPLYFRPPYGVTTPSLRKAVDLLQYTAVGWNIRTYDTVSDDPAQVLPRIEKQLTPGSVLLFHDRMPGTVRLLRASLDYLNKQGYRVVPLDELITS
jgi:peptidoglycan/xylan/chitin deacetylase (PgdA/CDA1 family)